MPVKVTKPSVIGKDSHTPVIFNKKDRKKAIGIIIKKPLDSEMICAGKAFSVDVKYADIMMLNPTNGIAVKYNFNPVTAIRCNCTFCSLLNTLTIGLADNKKIKYMPHDITNIVFKAYFKICF